MARKLPDSSEDPPPLRIVESAHFGKELERQRKRGKDLGKLRVVIQTLLAGRPLDARHRDHALTGDWLGYRDCHVEPDWLLIYQVLGDELRLARTGTHADLF